MKIKIIKAEPHKWYAKKIGKVFTAKIRWKEEDGDCYILRNYKTILRTVEVSDAIEIIDPCDHDYKHISQGVHKPVYCSNCGQEL